MGDDQRGTALMIIYCDTSPGDDMGYLLSEYLVSTSDIIPLEQELVPGNEDRTLMMMRSINENINVNRTFGHSRKLLDISIS